MYRKINLIAQDLQQRLEDSGKFKETRIAAVTGYDTLLKLHSNMSRFPAAVVCIGGGSLEDNNSLRELNIGIVLFDKFRGKSDKKAQGIWDVLDDTINILVPGTNRGSLKINGVAFLPQDFRALDLPGSNSVYMLEMRVLAPKQ